MEKAPEAVAVKPEETIKAETNGNASQDLSAVVCITSN